MHHSVNILVLCLGAAAVHTAELPPPANVNVDFARDIKPLLERSCIQCHGPERPRSGLRLDHREAAMKGGNSGVVIVPGRSAESVLVQVVAGIHPTIERMPPQDKGEPFTPSEISLLRAWIDQGAVWQGPDTTTAPQRTASVAPALRWIDVRGDESKFREHYGMNEGLHAGVENFLIEERPGPNSTVRVAGRLFPADDDFRLTLRYDRNDVGFVNAGVAQFTKYYDDSGGFYPFAQPMYSLERDLELRNGRLWADFGLTLPDWPKVALGYELQYRQGTKSTLQWGSVKSTAAPVLPDTGIERKIYPAFKEVDEKVHILKLDASHDFGGFFLEDNFRAEFSDFSTHRENALSVAPGQPQPTRLERVDESYDEFRAVNALRAEKEIRDWWFLSGGYLYSRADADAAFRQNTVHATGLPVAGDYWRSHSIILSQNSVLLNGNTRLGPWKDLTFSGGVQTEWMRQEGLGRVSLDSGNPAVFLMIQPATLDANLHKHTLQESAEVRYTGLPFTSLFAETRLAQESFGRFERQIGGDHAFVRDTDAVGNMKSWRTGFYSSPFRTVSFGGHVRQRNKQTDYDHTLDDTDAYPAFFRAREIDTEELEARVTWRALTWLKTTATYQLVDTDFETDTEAVSGATPGGRVQAGSFDADVYGLNLTLTPFSRWYFSGTFNYYSSRSASAENQTSIVPYKGDLYTALANVTFMLNTNTDLTATYTFSRADYAQDNFSAGLPLGINYDWHAVQAGLARRFRRVTANLQYGFYDYREPSAGGFNDYTAHAVFATVALHWR